MERARTALSASLEDYLEAIYHLQGRGAAAHASAVAGRLGVRGASVTGALRALAARRLVRYAPYAGAALTPRGRVLARGIVRRHERLRRFFQEALGLAPRKADACACRVEHVLPPRVVDRMAEWGARRSPRSPRGAA